VEGESGVVGGVVGSAVEQETRCEDMKDNKERKDKLWDCTGI
jgi:hypothetical protein